MCESPGKVLDKQLLRERNLDESQLSERPKLTDQVVLRHIVANQSVILTGLTGGGSGQFMKPPHGSRLTRVPMTTLIEDGSNMSARHLTLWALRERTTWREELSRVGFFFMTWSTVSPIVGLAAWCRAFENVLVLPRHPQ